MMRFCFLPKVHSEHRKRMRDADMLENHIIQARVQATATESQVHDTVVEEMGVSYHHLGLPAGKLEAPIIEQYETNYFHMDKPYIKSIQIMAFDLAFDHQLHHRHCTIYL